MAARNLKSLWEARATRDAVNTRVPPALHLQAPGSPDKAAPASPVSPARRQRVVSALKPPTFPALASGRPTEVTEEPLRLSPLSSFTSAGSTSPASSAGSAVGGVAAARARRRRAALAELDAAVAVLDHKLAHLSETLKALDLQASSL